MNFAILRVAKLKTFGQVAASTNHIHRTNETPNADPAKEHLNIHKGAKNAVEKIKEIWQQKGIKPRKDSVVGLEYVATASPDFFKDKSQKEINQWAKDTVSWMQKKHGDGLVNYSLHMDETTPHLHVTVTPIYHKGRAKGNKDKGWGLSAKKFTNGKVALAKMQDNYQEHMKAAGHDLDRGLKGSKAEHTQVKKFYSELEQEQENSRQLSADLSNEFDSLLGQETPSPLRWGRVKELFNQLKNTITDLTERLADSLQLNQTLTAKNKQLEKQLEQTKSETYDYLNKLKSHYPTNYPAKEFTKSLQQFARRDGANVYQAQEAVRQAQEAEQKKQEQLRQQQEKAAEIERERLREQQSTQMQKVADSSPKKQQSKDALPEYQQWAETSLDMKPQPCSKCNNFPCKCCRMCNTSPCECNKDKTKK